MTVFYGLRPWEVEQLTFRELDEYRRQMRKHNEEVKKAQAQMKRGRRG